ncbi:pap2 domain-containing protein [Ophiostoma piceae UAMH 11346]|uniref:Pap2 domain-containing protein n=1 Tax=Ophiostoma piceae (strain UAMH 11346) TaxID=1262450 RepID=S3CEB7_OPHP1|nr:pap2 domain-containing protein [Ophiostoma piceae UAMH 11346]
MPDLSTRPLIAHGSPQSSPRSRFSSYPRDSRAPPNFPMASRIPWGPPNRRKYTLLIASGVIDWTLVIAAAVGGYFLGDITPNKRPFQLENPDISFPYTVHETVTSRNLIIATVGVPFITIIIVSLLAVPGLAVPPDTPRSLIWRRKLWDMYASILSLALSMASQWFIINGLKNLCGKPRPDMLSRCQPDLENVARYVVGGIANITSNGQLVSADICTNTDISILDDGFRSYPSGHSGSSAAGLGFLALYLASKFGVVFPFAHRPHSAEAAMISSSGFTTSDLPRRSANNTYELGDIRLPSHMRQDLQGASIGKSAARPLDYPSHDWLDGTDVPMRTSGAAPPLFLLVIVLAPFFGSVFIAASRWFDYRHHGFDILFGYFIGTITGVFAYYMYQVPPSYGAGWAWGPRSADKAFWAGVGSHSWATPWPQWPTHARDEEDAYEPTAHHSTATPDSPISHHPSTLRQATNNANHHTSLEESV